MPFSKPVVPTASLYLAVAALSALSDWLAFLALGGLDPAVAQGSARLVGGTTSFVLNRQWTFGATGGAARRQASRFAALYVASWSVAVVTVLLLTTAGAAASAAKLSADCLAFSLNFFALRAWVFVDDTAPQKKKSPTG